MDMQVNGTALREFFPVLQEQIERIEKQKKKAEDGRTRVCRYCSGKTADAFSKLMLTWRARQQQTLDGLRAFQQTMQQSVWSGFMTLSEKADAVCAPLCNTGNRVDLESETASIDRAAVAELHRLFWQLQQAADGQATDASTVWHHIPRNEMSEPCGVGMGLLDQLAAANGIAGEWRDMLLKSNRALSDYAAEADAFEHQIPEQMEPCNALRPEKYRASSDAEIDARLKQTIAVMINTLCEKWAKDPATLEQTLKQNPDNITNTEYEALAEYYLYDCDTPEKQQEFFNAMIHDYPDAGQTTGEGAQDTMERSRNILSRAEQISTAEATTACIACDNYEQLAQTCGQEYADELRDGALRNASETAGRIGLMQAAVQYEQKHLLEVQEREITILQEGGKLDFRPSNQKITVSAAMPTDTGAVATQTITFSEDDKEVMRGTVNNYYDKTVLSTHIGDHAKKGIDDIIGTLSNATAEGVASAVWDAAWDVAVDKVLKVLEIPGVGVAIVVGGIKDAYDIFQQYEKNGRMIVQAESSKQEIDVDEAVSNLNLHGTQVVLEQAQPNDGKNVCYEEEPYQVSWNLRISEETSQILQSDAVSKSGNGEITCMDVLEDPVGALEEVSRRLEGK